MTAPHSPSPYPGQPGLETPDHAPRSGLLRWAIWVAIIALIAAALVCVVWVLVGPENGLIGRAFLHSCCCCFIHCSSAAAEWFCSGHCTPTARGAAHGSRPFEQRLSSSCVASISSTLAASSSSVAPWSASPTSATEGSPGGTAVACAS